MRNLPRPNPKARPTGRPSGFTLIELLVVVLIVLLVSAVTLPAVIPAVQNRQVSEGARILQAALAGARDAAVRANSPRGIRLIPDRTSPGASLTCSRIVPIEPAPDITDGRVTFPSVRALWAGNSATPQGSAPYFPFPSQASAANRGVYPYPLDPTLPPATKHVLMVTEVVYQNNSVNPVALPESPSNWFWNVRLGDKIRFADSGRYYTVVGPMTIANPEDFVNDGPPGTQSALQDSWIDVNTAPVPFRPQYLFLVNGLDDNGDGYPDQGFDGLNENLNYDTNNNPLTDDINEWVPGTSIAVIGTPETEQWLGSQVLQSDSTKFPVPPALKYTIIRRPVPTPGSRETSLPSACVIDLTTHNFAIPERSRLPVNANGTVDVLLNQQGQVVFSSAYSTPSSMPMAYAFYHFWISDRSDLHDPIGTTYPTLPLPDGLVANATRVLKRDRQLVTLYTRTGQVVTNSIENFQVDTTNPQNTDPNRPYRDAQLGIREAK